MRVPSRVLSIAAALVLALPIAARADPFHIVGGTVSLGADGLLTYSFATEGVSMNNGSTVLTWSSVGLDLGCASGGCLPGESLSFNNETKGDFFGNVTGWAKFGLGESNTDCCGVNPDTRLGAHWSFISAGGTLPTAGAPAVTLTSPFAFRGSFALAFCDPVNDCNSGLFFRKTGGGIASMQLQLTDAGYVIRPGSALTYEFSANPTPEPASMVLLGTGVAGLLVRRRRAT